MQNVALEKIHPAIREEVEAYDRLVGNASGIFRQYPVLHTALEAQRDFMALREQIWCWNSLGGLKILRTLMRKEGGEVVESVGQSLWRGQAVDGRTSGEVADYEIFAAQLGSLPQVKGEQLDTWSKIEIVAGLTGIGVLMKLFPGVSNDPRIIKGKVAENERNYPIRPNSAPSTWQQAEMAGLHGEMRPLQKTLRANMPGGNRKMDLVVHDALEERRETPPILKNAGQDYTIAYLAVVEAMVKYGL
ncbi:MAG: hypothetical protein WAV40_01860 [Microgenomates group bacterium]